MKTWERAGAGSRSSLATELLSQNATLLERLQHEAPECVMEHAANFGELVVRVHPSQWRQVAHVAREKLGCDYLSFISAIDWMPTPPVPGVIEGGGDTSTPAQPKEQTYGVAGSAGRFQVFACVASTADHWEMILKCDVDETEMSVESWTSVYPGADWHERETWEMFGIGFTGHPAMRHIFLPDEFEGFPLRKDFPLLAREVKPWPGLVDVEPMPGEDPDEGQDAATEGDS